MTRDANDSRLDPAPWRCLEFFAGIGGFATAARRVWSQRQLEIRPLEIDQEACRVYELNHPERVMTCEIQSLDPAMLANYAADMWWMSPPCQPYSQRGHQRDIDDPRAASLLFLIEQIERLRPRYLALENVQGFTQSRALIKLREVLQARQYHWMERVICPTQMGWPNRRPRFYLLASRDRLVDWQPLPVYSMTVQALIDSVSIDWKQCAVDADVVARFGSAMDRVDLARSDSVTACFGSSYGKSILHAGSYCQQADAWRRFAPEEVARLLGFPMDFRWPADLSYRRLWKLLGNSLSIPVVEYVLSHLADASRLPTRA